MFSTCSFNKGDIIYELKSYYLPANIEEVLTETDSGLQTTHKLKSRSTLLEGTQMREFYP